MYYSLGWEYFYRDEGGSVHDDNKEGIVLQRQAIFSSSLQKVLFSEEFSLTVSSIRSIVLLVSGF